MEMKTALIVGVGSGLSASLARLFAKNGLQVAMASRDPDKLKKLAEETAGVTFACEALDVAVITSASRDLTESGRVRWPDAGRLFYASGCGVGLPPTPWREAPLPG